MSQVEVATTPRFAKTKGRLAHRKQQFEGFLKTFEWSWTKAIVFSVGLTFAIVITTSVIPSFWLYFADQKLKWSGAGPNGSVLHVDLSEQQGVRVTPRPIL